MRSVDIVSGKEFEIGEEHNPQCHDIQTIFHEYVSTYSEVIMRRRPTRSLDDIAGRI